MNPTRKMCTLRKVDKVTPIEGADRIECAHVGGWTCVVGKNEFQPGDFAVYFEIDSFLPTNDPRYAQFAERGEKTMTIHGTPTSGHVLRTAKFRGQISQGFLAKPQVIFPDIPESAYETIYERKACLNGPANVCEYVPDTLVMSVGSLGKYDPSVAPRTDAERAQNIDNDVFDLIKRTRYFTSVKVDGSSTTIVYDPRHERMRIFSHNQELDPDAPGIATTIKNAAKRQGIWDFCEGHPGMAVQAEICGPKIQSNRLKLKQHQLFVFSMWDMVARRYLVPYNVSWVEPSCTPYYDLNITDMTRDDLICYVDGIRGNVTAGCLDEGLVIHVIGKGWLNDAEWLKLHNALGDTMQVKAISNEFLLKAK